MYILNEEQLKSLEKHLTSLFSWIFVHGSFITYMDDLIFEVLNFKWYDEWRNSLPQLSIPEWAKFDRSRLMKVTDKYDELKTRWAERDHVWLNSMQERLKGLEDMWRRGPPEGRRLF
uniref:Uncharacterized protein n=1 Tax=Parascaris equorum TaxID=6256 RepID=A0A914R1U8_PAREQ